jgi:(3,5-dihydroxyphenyl)acetyl-CoA 1,2-dioxygenase
VVVRREGRAGVVELRNPRHLNAEDDSTIPATEVTVDLVLLDPAIEVRVMRGGTVDHPRYARRRIFGAGINLTHLYYGQILPLLHRPRPRLRLLSGRELEAGTPRRPDL